MAEQGYFSVIDNEEMRQQAFGKINSHLVNAGILPPAPELIAEAPEVVTSIVEKILPTVRQYDLTWKEGGNCKGVDPDLFYPEKGESTVLGKAICRGCVVRAKCLDFALETSVKTGIWGGLSEYERRKLRSLRATARGASKTVTSANVDNADVGDY